MIPQIEFLSVDPLLYSLLLAITALMFRVAGKFPLLLSLTLTTLPGIFILTSGDNRIAPEDHFFWLLGIHGFLVSSLLAVRIIAFLLSQLLGERGKPALFKAALLWFAASSLILINSRYSGTLEQFVSNSTLSLFAVICLLTGLLLSIFRFIQSGAQVLIWLILLLVPFGMVTLTDLPFQNSLSRVVAHWEKEKGETSDPLTVGLLSSSGSSHSFHLPEKNSMSKLVQEYLNTTPGPATEVVQINEEPVLLSTIAADPEEYMRGVKPDILVISGWFTEFQRGGMDNISPPVLSEYETAIGEIIEYAHSEGIMPVLFFEVGDRTNYSEAAGMFKKRMMHTALLYDVPFVDGETAFDLAPLDILVIKDNYLSPIGMNTVKRVVGEKLLRFRDFLSEANL